jgi:hypothetical protein
MKQMNSKVFSVKLLLAVLLLSTLSVQAATWSYRDPHDAVPEVEEYEWAEERVELPAYPEKEKMVKINFNRPNQRFEFFIDPQTLTVGDDGVVRYVLMLRSLSGSENIMFEGIRCDKRDYKTFAFGTSKDTFRELTRPTWKEITQTSNSWFRHDLWKHYFCFAAERFDDANTREKILRRLNIPTSLWLKK